MANLDSAFDDYVTAMLKWDSPIPEPARKPQLERAVSPLVSPLVTAVRITEIREFYDALRRSRTASSALPTAKPVEVEGLNIAEKVAVG